MVQISDIWDYVYSVYEWDKSWTKSKLIRITDVHCINQSKYLFILFQDIDRNDGSAEKPYYMSRDLRKILGKMENKSSSQPQSPVR